MFFVPFETVVDIGNRQNVLRTVGLRFDLFPKLSEEDFEKTPQNVPKGEKSAQIKQLSVSLKITKSMLSATKAIQFDSFVENL